MNLRNFSFNYAILILSVVFIFHITGDGQENKPGEVEKQEAKKLEINCADQDYDCLLKKWDNVLKENPKDSQGYFMRGRIYLHRSNLKRAIENLTKAVELKPDFINAYTARAAAFSGLEKYDLSIQDNTKAIKLDKTNSLAFVNRGIEYLSLNVNEKAKLDFEKAIKILNKQIQLSPYESELFGIRALAYRHLKETDKAIADYYQAINLDPTYYQNYYFRGRLYLEQNNYSLALEDFSKAIELDAEFANAYESRMLLYQKIGENIKAFDDSKKYFELKNKD